MGVKILLPFLFLIMSFSSVFSNICTSEIAEKIAASCHCNGDDWDSAHDAFAMSCAGVKSIGDYQSVLRKSVPEDTEFKLKFLITSFNTTANLFKGLNVTHLRLAACKILNIADDDSKQAFIGLEDTLENLEILIRTFKYPRREDYYRDEAARFTLGHLRRVRNITMKNNELWSIDNYMFARGPKSLEILDLTFNRIYELGDRAFANLTNLKKLLIGSNKLLHLKRSMFPDPAPCLEEMDFSLNVLRELPMNMFDNMPSLKRLNFVLNQLSVLHERTWIGIWSHLKYLQLYGNPIRCDKTIEWLFKARKISHLSGECSYPMELLFRDLETLQEEKKKEAKEF